MSNDTPIDLSPDNLARMVSLVFGTMADGKPYWVIAAVKPSAMGTVQGLIKAKSLNWEAFQSEGYGEIVVSGEGLMPPKDVLKVVSQMFNVPLRSMFGHFNFDDIMAKEIEWVKKEMGID